MHPGNRQRRNTPLAEGDGIRLPFDQRHLFGISTVQVIGVGTSFAEDFARRIVVLLAGDRASAEVGQTPSFQMNVDQHSRREFADDGSPLVGQVEVCQQRPLVLWHEAEPRRFDGGELPAACLGRVVQRGRGVEQRLVQPLHQLAFRPRR